MINYRGTCPNSYHLTDTTSICCHGTCFPDMATAKNYAELLKRECGLCKTYSIGCYIDGKYVKVYES